MIVLNGMPWVPYAIRSLYPFVDEFIVVEGATLHASDNATRDGHSLDDTVSAIKALPDPDRKLTLIQKDGFWPGKTEMSQAYTNEMRTDWLWMIDSDEFYMPSDVLRLQAHLRANPNISAVAIKTLNFFAGTEAIVKGARFAYGDDWFWRIFRWGAGYEYASHHGPLLLTDPSGRDLTTQNPYRARFMPMYHYSYVTPQQVRTKTYLHGRIGKRMHGRIDYFRWYDRHFQTFTPYRVHMDKRPVSYLVPFRGEHPPIINELLSEHPIETPPTIKAYLKNPLRWRWWRMVGQIDAGFWWLYDRPFRRAFRPLVRFFRARFLGYDYSGEKS